MILAAVLGLAAARARAQPFVPAADLEAPSIGRLFDGAKKEREAAAVVPPNKQDRWRLRLSFGPTFAQYADSDVRLRNSRMDLTLRDVRIVPRPTMGAYAFWQDKNPLQFIDEPTNTFVLSLEDLTRAVAIDLVLFHPKYALAGDGDNTHVLMRGSLEGKPVNGWNSLEGMFDLYQITRLQYNVQLQVEKLVTLVAGSAGRLVYAPGLGVGGYFGYSQVAYRAPDGAVIDSKAPYRPIGVGVSLSNRLTFTLPGDVVSASLRDELGAARLHYRVLDGYADQALNSHSLGVTLDVKLY